MSETRHALIAGAGIGGLAAALALARAGLRVTILEQAAELVETGAGLQLSPNASGLLDRLGILRRLDGLALYPERLRVRSGATGSDLMSMPLGRAAQARWGAPTLVAHRADLQSALLAAVSEHTNITLRKGVQITGLVQDGPLVRVETFSDAGISAICGDLLVGADGLHSRVRSILYRKSTPVFSGRVAWRALIPAEQAPAFARQPETGLWLGSRAHLVHYPLRQASEVNIIAIVDDQWRDTKTGEFWSSRGLAHEIGQRFDHWHRDARRLIEGVADWRRWPLFDCEPLPRWSSGHVTLLGDAAHAMLPFFAQGAAQAIEDAGALGEAFSAQAGGPVSTTRALAEYDRRRVARAARVQKASRQQGTIYHLPGPAALIRDMGMRALPPEAVMARFDWLYAFPPR